MAPTDSAGQPVRIAQITDFHLMADPAQAMLGVVTEQSFLAVLDRAARGQAAAALFLLTGDLAQEPGLASYRRLRGYVDALPVRCHCLPGNHDAPALMREVLGGGGWPSQILLDGWQVVCLDSSIPGDPGGRLGEAQLARLDALLAAQPRRHALVALHHSPMPVGSAWLDTMRLEDADALAALLKRHPQVKAILCGHVHQAMDADWDGVRCLACPSTCFQFKPGSEGFALDFLPPGYRWLGLYPDGRIETAVERLDSVPEGLEIAATGGY
jgi:Icc protein